MQAALRYLKDRGLKPGMGLLDLYSTINAGRPGLYNRSDAANGGAWGTVLDKVTYQMEGHKKNADKLLGQLPGAVQTAAEKGTKIGAAQGVPAGFEAIGANMTGSGGNGFSALAGMAGAALGGFSTGYQSASPGMGLLGGAMQGLGAGMQMASLFPAMATALPVIGVAVGAVAGICAGGLRFKRKDKYLERDQYFHSAESGCDDDGHQPLFAFRPDIAFRTKGGGNACAEGGRSMPRAANSNAQLFCRSADDGFELRRSA
jgi:hypothetical protein